MAVSKKKSAKKVSVAKKSTAKKTRVKKPAVTNNGVNKPKKNNASKKKAEKKTDKNIFVLNTALVINGIKSLQEALSVFSENNNTVTLDASNVEMIDTAGFQILLAFVNTMNVKKISIIWKTPSDVLLERALILNLTDDLGLQKVDG